MKRRIVLPEVEEVKLPVLFSMRPGMYLLILYTLFIAAAIFCIAFLPGILKGGRYVTFPAPLSESGIVLDGTYLGSADNQYFIESGSHEITYMKGGVPYASSLVEVDHPVFLTWLFHRTKTADSPVLSMSAEQKLEVIRYNLEQIQTAGAILSYDAVTRYEGVYTNLITDLIAMDVYGGARYEQILNVEGNDYPSKVNTSQLGLTGGTALRFFNKFSINASYYYGLTSLFADGTGKTTSFNFSFNF